MTNINNIEDFERILQERPEWRQRIRHLLLGEEILSLPAKVAELTEAVAELTTTVKLLTARVGAIETKLDQHIADTAENFRQVREDISANQADTAENFRQVREDISAMQTDIGTLQTDTSTLKSDTSTLKSDMASLKGAELERTACRRIHGLAYRTWGITDSRLLQGATVEPHFQFRRRIIEAERNGTISEAQSIGIDAADIILSGVIEDIEVMLAAEVSITVNQHDIDRAKERAASLQAASGMTCYAAVLGENISGQDHEYADAQGVTFISIAATEQQRPQNPLPEA